MARPPSPRIADIERFWCTMGRTKRHQSPGNQYLVLEVRRKLHYDSTGNVSDVVRMVAAEHGVGEVALKRSYYRHQNAAITELKRSSHHTLTIVQELVFVSLILSLARNLTPVTIPQAVPIIQSLSPGIEAHNARKMIYRLVRHTLSDQLRLAKGKLLNKTRASVSSMEPIEEFISAVERGPKYSPKQEINADEHIIYAGAEPGEVIVERWRNKAQAPRTSLNHSTTSPSPTSRKNWRQRFDFATSPRRCGTQERMSTITYWRTCGRSRRR